MSSTMGRGPTAPTILVVDDNLQNRLVAEARLVAAGYRVISAESGERALELFVSETCHLVLLDVRMPGLDGFETLERLRRRRGRLLRGIKSQVRQNELSREPMGYPTLRTRALDRSLLAVAGSPLAGMHRAIMRRNMDRTTIADADSEATEHLLAAGTQLGAHVVIRGVLGEGGTAVVYDAFHTELKRHVAVKMLHPNTRVAREARARLIREGRICESIHDPRVPKIYFIDELEDGTPYMVMEKIEGPTLAKLIESGPIPASTACTIAAHLLDGLAAIHGHGVVHRDIKPSNIILQPRDDGTVRVRLMDFGIGKITGGAAGPEVTGITRQGDIIGTPCYMPPEQLMSKDIDARVDLYATGVMLFEMLTGRVPYDATSIAEVVAAVLRDEMPSVRTFRPELPIQIAEVVAKACAKDKSLRYASAERMKIALVAAVRASKGARDRKAALENEQYV